jgi:putative membrane protein
MDWAFYLSFLPVGTLLWRGSQYRTSLMPVWGPWEFSWVWFLATALALWWYWRGVVRLPGSERPAAWRCVCYVTGVLAIYAGFG